MQIIPEAWIEDIVRNGDPDAWVAGDLAGYFPGAPLRYRNQWYVYDSKAPVVFAIGVHGHPCTSTKSTRSSSRRCRRRPCRSTLMPVS